MKNNDFENLTKSQQECLNLIDTLGIYELRALARVFGDNSPTTLKRNDHIKIVMNKIISGEDLKPIPLRQGRPYKELNNIEGILSELSQLTGKDYTLKQNQQRFQKIVNFRQIEDEIYNKKLFPIEVRGFLQERNNEEFYFINLDNSKVILVKKSLNLKLKAFDYITGTAVVMNNEKDYILDNVKTINFIPENEYIVETTPYENALPSKKITFLKQNVLLGGRYILPVQKFIDKHEEMKALVKALKNENIITIALVPNVLYEYAMTIKSIGFDNTIMVMYDENPEILNELCTCLIKNIKRLQEQEKSVALFVEDAITVANGIDYTFKTQHKSLMGHTENAVNTIKNIMMLASASQDGNSTTVFCTFDQIDTLDSMFVSSIYKISKKIDI